MRLSENIRQLLKSSIKESFGDVKVYLFGSRVDDKKKGGDIDIAIESDISREDFRRNKIKFFTSLIKKDFDLKVDLVKYTNDQSLLSKEIEKNKILL